MWTVLVCGETERDRQMSLRAIETNDAVSLPLCNRMLQCVAVCCGVVQCVSAYYGAYI